MKSSHLLLYVGCFGFLFCILSLLQTSIKIRLIEIEKCFLHLYQKIRIQHLLNQSMQAVGFSQLEIKKRQRRIYQTLFLSVITSFLLALVTQIFFWLSIPFLYIFIVLRFYKKQWIKRNHQITIFFPYFLDLLILSLRSGMELTRSIAEISQTANNQPLCKDMQWVIKATHVGANLPKALFDLADKTGHDEIHFLASAVSQSYELGNSLTQGLMIHAQTLRTKIFQSAQAQAQKAPVKILFPLIFCIFPVIFLMIFLPIVVSVFQFI